MRVAAPLAVVLPLVFAGAALYASVGHGGATVYLAILTLAGFAVGELTTTVLVLNLLAAAIGFVMFERAGHLRWRLLVPFVVTSVPAAYLGGRVDLTSRAQEILLGVALLAGAARLLFVARPPDLKLPREGAALFVGAPALGALLGFLAGATGIGGGIFLSPILLATGWANVKETGGIAAAFIALNSAAGLAAKLPRTPLDVGLLAPLATVVVAGALLGAFLGARRLPPRRMTMLLGVVLALAGARAVLGA